MPSAVPMLPATMVSITPTINDTRAPKIRRLNRSRAWKSVPSNACVLPPCIQNGGSKIFASGIGSVGSYGAIQSAKSASRMNGTRIASGSTGNCRARPVQRRGTLAKSRAPIGPGEARVSSMVETMAHLLGQANAWIDVGVEEIDDQID